LSSFLRTYVLVRLTRTWFKREQKEYDPSMLKAVLLALLLFLSAVVALGFPAGTQHQGVEAGPGIVETTLAPNFNLSASPSLLTIPPDGSDFTVITVNSFGGFVSYITLTASVSPNVLNAPTWSIAVNPMITGGTQAIIIGVHGTPPGTYTVTFTGSNATTSRSVNVTVVTTGPDFTITAKPSFLNLLQGSIAVVTLNLTSIHDSSGQVSFVNLQFTPFSPVGLSASLSPASLYLPLNGSAPARLMVFVSSGATPGFFGVEVTGASSSMTGSIIIPVSVGPIPLPPVLVGLKWDHKLDLSHNPSTLETWLGKVVNNSTLPLYVQMSIALTSSTGLKLTTFNPVPVLIGSGLKAQIVVNQFFSLADVGLKYCFTAQLSYGTTPGYLPFTSPKTLTGCFTIT
jgi:hypothetical protein